MLGVLLDSPFARADDARCTSARVVEAAALTAPWRSAVDALRGDLASLRDCLPSTISIAPAPGGVRLTLTTADGRRAERFVTSPDALGAVAVGLVASIPADVAPPAADAAKAAAPDDARAVASATSRTDGIPAAPQATLAARPVRVDAGAIAGIRVGMPTRVLVADVELRADVLVEGWFLLAAVRYAPLGVRFANPTIPGYVYDEVVVSIGAGRRFGQPPFVLDAAIATSLAVMTEEGDVPDGTGGTTSGARIAANARLLFGRSRARVAASVYTELAPVGAAPTVDPALPSLPTWTVGVGVGVVGDVL
jgi:hypothetical protein